MSLVIPLQPVPSQTLTVLLGFQQCRINVFQKATGLFCDLHVNDAAIVTGVLALNNNRIVRSAYLGFAGDLIFYDTQGVDDPDYTDLGGRFVLLWTGP